MGGHEGCPEIEAQGLTFGEIWGKRHRHPAAGREPVCGFSATEGSSETGTLTLGSLMRCLSSAGSPEAQQTVEAGCGRRSLVLCESYWFPCS